MVSLTLELDSILMRLLLSLLRPQEWPLMWPKQPRPKATKSSRAKRREASSRGLARVVTHSGRLNMTANHLQHKNGFATDGYLGLDQ